MPAPSNNPFSQGYGAIFAALLGWPALTALVAPGNFAAGNLQAPGFRPRTNEQAGDRPMLRLEEKRIQGSPWFDSRNVLLKCLYPLTLQSGRMGIDRANLVATVAFQALLNAGPFLGLPDLIVKWDWQDAMAIPWDAVTRRPDWTITGGVLMTFGFDRNLFLETGFS